MGVIALAQILYLNPCILKFAGDTSSFLSLNNQKLSKKQYLWKNTKFNVNNFCKYLPSWSVCENLKEKNNTTKHCC